MKARNAVAVALTVLGASATLSTATAHAAPRPDLGTDGWPVSTTDSGPVAFVTPDQPAFWDVAQPRPRLLSPFGTSTRIVCDTPQRC